MEGPEELPADDEDDLFAREGDDLNEKDEVLEGSLPSEKQSEPHDPKSESQEELKVKFKKSPCLPSKEEVDRHDTTHCPYRSWCDACVRSKAREDAHARKLTGRDDESGLPVISMDYDHLENKITVLVAKDEETGSLLAYDCTKKGPGDEWVMRQLVRDLSDWGREDICLKTDGEPSMIAVQAALATMRKARTVPRNPPVYNPQSNGAAEKAVQDVNAQARCLLLALESRVKCKIDPGLPIVRWLIRHAAYLLTRYSVGHDGLTAWRRLTGKSWKGTAFEFGERVYGKLALKRSSTQRKTKRGKKKLAARSVEGVYLGVYPRTGEHIIEKADGEAIRVRTVNRMIEEKRWNADVIKAVESLPRRPNPKKSAGENIEGKLNVNEMPEPPDGRGEGEPIDRPEHADAHTGPRELRINDRLLEKFGYTPGCPGCIHKQLGLEGHRGHSTECRRRIYEAMRVDADEVDRLIKNEEKLSKTPGPEEKIRRPTAPDAPVPKPGGDLDPGGDREETRDQPAEPADAVPEEPASEVEEVDMANDENPDDYIAQGCFDPSDDEDDNEPIDAEQVEQVTEPVESQVPFPEPNAKRQRLSQLMQKAVHLNGLNQELKSVNVKRILKDIEGQSRFQIPRNRRQRRTLSQEGYGKDVAEVYSPRASPK